METYITYLQTVLALITFYLLFKRRKSNKVPVRKELKVTFIIIVLLSLLSILYLIANNLLILDDTISYIDYFRYFILFIWIMGLLLMLFKKDIKIN